jgi:DNA-binding response OmpR family regulator
MSETAQAEGSESGSRRSNTLRDSWSAPAPADPTAQGRPHKLLIYSSSPEVREQVRMALGRRPLSEAPEVEYVDAATGQEVLAACDRGGIDLVILDGEAWPTGGMGLARQLRDELTFPPSILVLVGRLDDGWLATWSRADSVVGYPIDPLRLAGAVTGLLRRLPNPPALSG